MNRLINLSLLILAASASMFATVAPEIDPATGTSAITLLAGAALVIRARSRR